MGQGEWNCIFLKEWTCKIKGPEEGKTLLMRKKIKICYRCMVKNQMKKKMRSKRHGQKAETSCLRRNDSSRCDSGR